MADIIKDGDKLNAHIASTLKNYHNVGRAVHVAVVSVVYHACVHGNVTPMNTLIRGLRPNDASAFRLFLRRAHAIIGLNGANPEMQPQELIAGAIEAGGVFDLKNVDNVPTFTMKRDQNSKQAKTLADLCEKRFINPDGTNDKFILDRNNFTEVRTLGDEDALKAVVALAKRFEAEADTRKLKVSTKVTTFLKKFRDDAETMLNQTTLAKG